jgi:hypothetical protein
MEIEISSGFAPAKAETASSYIAQEFAYWSELFQAQPFTNQHYLEAQGQALAEAIQSPAAHTRFRLPDRVLAPSHGRTQIQQARFLAIPEDQREQVIGDFADRLKHVPLHQALRQRLDSLEASSSPEIALSAGLVRYSTAHTMIYNLLPAGRDLQYVSEPGENVPSIPLERQPGAIQELHAAPTDDNQLSSTGDVFLTPYVPAARRFYLPQWVAFDERGRLLVGSIRQAEASIASMQAFLQILHTAFSLAPYIAADPVYQSKRNGMLGQLINQGRALSTYSTHEVIEAIQQRVAGGTLNRGLSISLQFFDDQALELRTREIEVIPAGRVMFVPAFVVLACRREAAKIAQDTRLSSSTRKHLLEQLRMIEHAFNSSH